MVTSDTGAVFVSECETLPSPCADNPSADCGKCQYRVFVGPNCTAANPCDDLLLYWSNFGCDTEGLADFSTPANLAIPHWYMITEGSDFNATSQRCDMDVVPAEPYQTLCAAIDADATHTCELHARPSAGHCASFNVQFASSCLSWFRSL